MRIATQVLATLFLVLAAGAQSLDRYSARSWSIEDGLPQSSVRAIAQTPDGYLWIGTWAGLARFDGVRFKVYTAGNTPSIVSTNIQSLFTDSRGTLWIGQDGGGLARYERGQFDPIDAEDGVTSRRIHAIGEDSSGRVWFSTERGVYCYDGIRFRRFMQSDGLPSSYGNQVAPLPDGRVYLGFVGRGVIVRLLGDSLVVDDSFEVGGRQVAVEPSGALLIPTVHRTVERRRLGRSTIEPAFARQEPADLFGMKNGAIWRTGAREIGILDQHGYRTLRRIDGIDLISTGPVFEDREGNIWLAKEGAGILRLRRRLVESFTHEDGLPSPQAAAGLADPEGNIWIGLWNGGVARTVARNPLRFKRVPLPAKIDDVPTMCQSSDGTMWIGTWGNGLWTLRGGAVAPFVHRDLPSEVSIVALSPDPAGGIWLATAHDGLRHILGDRIERWDTSNGLSSNRINSLVVSRTGVVWAGTSGGGINQVHPDGRVSVITRKEGAVDDFVLVVREDSEGAIWVGSERGLQRWKDGSAFVFTERNGLAEVDICQLLEDDDGFFWMGAVHGIARISRRQLSEVADGRRERVDVLTVGKEDGMVLEEASGGHNSNSWRSRDGGLWFTTTAGPIRIDPRGVFTDRIPPLVSLEETWVDHRLTEQTDPLTLVPGQTKIEIQYTGISLVSPQKVRFMHMLEGFDPDWRDAGTRRLVQYTNLDPGTYTFRVRAMNSAGVWSVTDASMPIIVQPPYWATWWFRGIIIALFLSVGPLIYWRRVTGLKREQERQREYSRSLIEQQESERKRIAGELHDGLGQQLLVIKNRLLMSMQPGSSTSLSEISDMVGSAIEEVRAISHNLRPHQLDQLGLTKTLRAVVRQMRESTHLIVTAHLDDIDGFLGDQEEISLFRIVQEALNNVSKHSGASEVIVTTRLENGSLVVEVSDNGRGFDVRRQTEAERLGHSFGLSGMAERARMFGWEFSISSAEHDGTTIRIRASVVDGRGNA